MSFILDALKKLEQEKAARRSGNVNISDEILRGNYRVSRTAKPAVPMSAIVVGLGVLLLVLVVATTFLWRQRGVVRETENTPVEVSAGNRKPIPAESAPLPPSPRMQEAPPVRDAAPPAPRTEPPPQPVAFRAPRTETPARTSPPPPVGDRGGDSYQGGGTAGSGLMVSGIAWQEQRSSRRAVVNGLLFSEGKTVGGAKIVEIMPNCVRFSSNGRTFEVSISSTQLGK